MERGGGYLKAPPGGASALKFSCLGGGFFSAMNSSGSSGVVDGKSRTLVPFQHEYIARYTNGVFVGGKFTDASLKERCIGVKGPSALGGWPLSLEFLIFYESQTCPCRTPPNLV
jgi:hypothetical protein